MLNNQVGQCSYRDHFPGDTRNVRIVIPVQLGGITVQAIVDTGAPWNIIDPEIVHGLGIGTNSPKDQTTTVYINGVGWSGPLMRLPMKILATKGNSIEVEGGFFVPHTADGRREQYIGPNFIGYNGALERIRFAVNPLESTFHFGTL